eukprot:GILK01011293.1.p1 GENE.GILK01011293.1~~GILK01011293.1.p1  ORF type:complete len:186 (-),score=41.74 GILK01011293.1:51-608(-)
MSLKASCLLVLLLCGVCFAQNVDVTSAQQQASAGLASASSNVQCTDGSCTVSGSTANDANNAIQGAINNRDQIATQADGASQSISQMTGVQISGLGDAVRSVDLSQVQNIDVQDMANKAQGVANDIQANQQAIMDAIQNTTGVDVSAQDGSAQVTTTTSDASALGMDLTMAALCVLSVAFAELRA